MMRFVVSASNPGSWNEKVIIFLPNLFENEKLSVVLNPDNMKWTKEVFDAVNASNQAAIELTQNRFGGHRWEPVVYSKGDYSIECLNTDPQEIQEMLNANQIKYLIDICKGYTNWNMRLSGYSMRRTLDHIKNAETLALVKEKKM